jgi:hypothetical protein
MNHTVTDPDLAVITSKWERFGHASLRSVDRQMFFQQGYIQLEGLLSTNLAEALSSEARSVLLTLQSSEPGQAQAPIEQGLASSRCQAVGGLAPLLVHLHLYLVPLVRALTGRVLVPAHAWYNFYLDHDGMRLHVDTEGSELVLLTTAMGDVRALHLHPELYGRTQDELEVFQRDSKWKPESGVPMDYPRFGFLAHRGHVLPHHRPGCPVSEPCAVAAFHYSSLF